MAFKFLVGMVIFVALSLLAGRWLMNKALGDRREPTPQEWAEIQARQGPQPVQPTGLQLPATPLELKPSLAPRWEDLGWFIGLLFGALCLFSDPSILWTRWLSWPVAAGMVLLSCGSALSVVAHWRASVVASASGLAYRDGSGFLKQVAWSDVGAAKLMSYYGRRVVRQGTNAPTTLVLERQTLLLLDRAGRPLLEVDAPLRPPFQYQQLLDALPVWTGAPVMKEERKPS